MAYYNADDDLNAEKLPIVDRMDAEYTLYVNDIPLELNEDAIKDVFNHYGKIVGMFHPRNAKWAYITYGTYREAEHAIRDLDGKKPLKLKVALAKERTTKEEQKSNVSETFVESARVVNTADSVHNDMKSQSTSHGQSLNASAKRAMPPITVQHRYADSALPLGSRTPYEIDDPYWQTNQLWTRGVITVTPDGRRHVSLGRGYTLYTFPEQDPNIEEYVSKVYERRNNGLYEYSRDKLNGVQNCVVCSTKTIKHCERCLTYYCSKVCQLEDWPQHEAQCRRIP